MSNCQSHRESIEKHLAGELGPAEREAFAEHCATCPDCRQLAALHGLLTGAGRNMPEPMDAEFRAMREQVLLDTRRSRPRRSWRRFWKDLSGTIRLHPIGAPAVLAAMLVGALLLGRWSASPAEIDRDELLVQDLTAQAASQVGLAGFWDSPFVLTNVVVRPQGGGQLALSFDVCRHVDMTAARNSPVVKEVLLHAILDPSALGSRLKAMELTPGLVDPALREALVFTMHHDPSLAVRLKALATLSSHPFDAEVREALLTTLRRDQAVQMRLLALESLAGNQVETATIAQAIRDANQESDPAVLQHAVLLGRGL